MSKFRDLRVPPGCEIHNQQLNELMSEVHAHERSKHMNTPVTHDAAEWQAIGHGLADLQPEHYPNAQHLNQIIENAMSGAWVDESTVRRLITIDLKPEEIEMYRMACKRTQHANRLHVKAKI